MGGEVSRGFEPVRDAFAALFERGEETGAGFAAIAGGRVVADLWGGSVGRGSLVHVYSVAKPLAAACALLAAEPAWWPPGSAHGEHALHYGTLLGEVVRRVDGRTLGELFRDDLAGPWDLDVHIGLAPEQDERVAPLADPCGAWGRELLAGGDETWRLALDNPPALAHVDVINSPAWRRAEVPAVNAHAAARGIARFYAGLLAGGRLDGVRVLGERTVAEMTSAQASGRDRLLGEDTTWGLGVGLDEGGWGMGGIGGSIGWADPPRGLAWAYVTTRMGDHERALAVERALIAAAERGG